MKICHFTFRFQLDVDERLKIKEVSLAVSNMERSIQFWKELLEMKVISCSDNECVLNYDPVNQANLRLVTTDPKGTPVDHATAFGRIAFSLPTNDLPQLESNVKNGQLGSVKTPLVVLDTPGKADVQVVILEDPVRYSICTKNPLEWWIQKKISRLLVHGHFP